MRSSHTLARVETTFDDDWVVPYGGLQAPAALAQKLGLAELIDQRVRLPAAAAGRANAGVKALTVIGAMLAGGDSIDDVGVLRAGAAPKVFTATRAASTVGTWLRGFIWATVRMLDAVSRIVLARAWTAGLGPDLDADLTIDVDSTICQIYGTAKQGARFGYTKVRGYHRCWPRLRPPARCCTRGCAAATPGRRGAPAASCVRPSGGCVTPGSPAR